MKLKTSKKLRCITVLLAFTMLLTIFPGYSVASTDTRVEGEGTINGYDYEFGMKTISESNVSEEHSEVTEITSYTETIIEPGEGIFDEMKTVFDVDSEFRMESDAFANSTFSATGFVVLINGSNLALGYVGLESMTGTFNFTASFGLNMNITAYIDSYGIINEEETHLASAILTMGVVINVEMTFEVDLTWYGSLQVISQAMVTPDDSFMIWQNMMQDFLVYKDVNGNDIFDLNLEQLDVTDIMKEEFRGMGRPGIFDLNGAYNFAGFMGMDMVLKLDDGTVLDELHNSTQMPPDSGVIDETYPENFDPDDIDISTQFSAAAEEDVTTFEWGITYEHMPTCWAINDSSGVWHEGAVEQDYTYGYEYVINDTAGSADLYTTFSMSEMPAGELKTAVTGYGLAVPTYAAFFVVNPVESSIDDAHTQPVEVFFVSYQNETYAEYDFADPDKVEYDWSLGTSSSVYDSEAASVNVAVIEGRMQGTSILEQEGGELDWLLFADGLADALQDTGGESYDFVLALNVLTTNYPVWSGGAIEHDPVMRAYFLSTGEEGDGDEEFEMPAALAVGVLAAVIAVLFFVKMRGGKSETGEW